VFKEPTQLPPSCAGFDHKIASKEGVQPLNLKPYRFSLIWKNIIDKLVQYMLKEGIVQHSTGMLAASYYTCPQEGWIMDHVIDLY
jgi:hypothetical protein